MVRALLIRGMLAGALAGLLACGFAWFFGEPQVDLALGFEQRMHALAGEASEPALVSRAVQSTAGLLTGIVVYGCAIGGIFSLVFAYVYGRVGRLSPRAMAAVLAALGFAALIVVPQVKYPADPPAIGEPDTIAMRTGLYFTMVALSLITAVATILTARHLTPRLGIWNGAVVGGVAYSAMMCLAMLILPPGNEVPAEFSATTLWNFRLASLGIEGVLWMALGLIFGEFAERQIGSAQLSRL